MASSVKGAEPKNHGRPSAADAPRRGKGPDPDSSSIDMLVDAALSDNVSPRMRAALADLLKRYGLDDLLSAKGGRRSRVTQVSLTELDAYLSTFDTARWGGGDGRTGSPKATSFDGSGRTESETRLDPTLLANLLDEVQPPAPKSAIRNGDAAPRPGQEAKGGPGQRRVVGRK